MNMIFFIALNLSLLSFQYDKIYTDSFVNDQFKWHYVKVNKIEKIIGNKTLKTKDNKRMDGMGLESVCEIVFENGVTAVYRDSCDVLINKINDVQK